MKKILSVISAITLAGTGAASVVACDRVPGMSERVDITKYLKDKLDLFDVLGHATVNDFKENLQKTLQLKPGLGKITPSDYDVYHAGKLTPLDENDFKDIKKHLNNDIYICIVTKGFFFTGIKDELQVNFNNKVDLKDIIPNNIDLFNYSISKLDPVESLKNALSYHFDMSSLFLSEDEYDLYQPGTTILITDKDVLADTTLKVKFVSKGEIFTGQQDNVTITYKLD